MATMKQLWFEERGRMALREVEVPPVGPGQVKVKVAYTAICATDAHQVSMGVMNAEPPMPMGHESSGTVVELGEGTENTGLSLGDKVCLAPVTYCGACPPCKQGTPQYCEHLKNTGSFAQYVVTDQSAVFKLPPDADLRQYALVEPAACTLRAMELAPIPHGATVAVSGIGGIGSILLNQVILSGGAQVTAIDPVPDKRELARAMGAQFTVDPFKEDLVQRAMEITDDVGFDFIFEVSGSPRAALPPLKMMAKCGTVVYFAVFPPDYELPLNLHELYMKEGRIQTVFTTPFLMPKAISLLPRMQLDKVIGKIMPLDEVLDAFKLFEKSIHPKILIDCS